MPYGKRRKGKQWSNSRHVAGGSVSGSGDDPTSDNEDDKDDNDNNNNEEETKGDDRSENQNKGQDGGEEEGEEGKEDQGCSVAENESGESPTTDGKSTENPKGAGKSHPPSGAPGRDPPAPRTPSRGSDEVSAMGAPSTSRNSSPTKEDASLVLTSEKRRGVFECDYCHADISQLPRIRCAVCADFDLCFDCFATTTTAEHAAAMARLKEQAAEAAAEQEQQRAESPSDDDTGTNSASLGLLEHMSGSLQHDDSHGYRVCDSTRYPLFPTRKKRPHSHAAAATTGAGAASTIAGGGTPKPASTSKKSRGATPPPPSLTKKSADDDEKKKESDATDTDGPAEKEDETMLDDDAQKKKEEEGDSPEAMDVDPPEEDNNKKKGDSVDDEKELPAERGSNSNEASAIEEDEDDDNTGDATASDAMGDGTGCTNASVTKGEDEEDPDKEWAIEQDPRIYWTVEEDLRLIEAIRSHGLGNWVDVSEAVSGQGSVGKTPKRCMERYLDDFLGRYGHILPPYTLVDDEGGETNASSDKADGGCDGDAERKSGVGADGGSEAPSDDGISGGATEAVRSSKRRSVLMRSPSGISSTFGGINNNKYKMVSSDSFPNYERVWPKPYLPTPDVVVGQPVLREQAVKSEQAFVRTIAQLEDASQVAKVRREWTETLLGKPGGPTVLPMRPEDTATMPGAELAGFMPRRGDFDVEWDNDAEQCIADMEFLPRESDADKNLKLQVLAIYNAKLDEREKRKQFVLSRGLYDYRKNQQEEQKLPLEERDLVHRMRLFERFHTPSEHEQFLSDLLKAKRLRKEVAKLQMYHRLGIRTLAEAELYELDKTRRNFHKSAQLQKEAETAKAAAATSSAATGDSAPSFAAGALDETVSASLWKQYRTATTDRKTRKSINRGSSFEQHDTSTAEKTSHVDVSGASAAVVASRPAVGANSQPMEIDDGDKKAFDKEPSLMSKEGVSNAVGESLASMPGYHLLLRREADLCRKLQLAPLQYQSIKAALIQESLCSGLLDKEAASSSRRAIVKIDAERRGNVIDFLVKAGWISNKRAVAMVTPPPQDSGENPTKRDVATVATISAEDTPDDTDMAQEVEIETRVV